MEPVKLPENVNFILKTLENAGYEAYIVGGCVRDILMNKEPKDWDIATSAEPSDAKLIFERTYDTGLKHGTITALVNEQRFEITTFRIDGVYYDNRRPDSVVFSKSIGEDLKRRDFTINAIAYNPKTGFVDPFDGSKDIKGRLVKGVGNADERLKEDALRMLRAIRFSAVLGFEIEEDTAGAVISNAPLITKISPERIRDEIFRIICSPAPYSSVMFTEPFYTLMDYIYMPLTNSLKENKQTLEDLFEHCKRDKVLRMAIFTYYLDSAQMTGFLDKLRLSNSIYDKISVLHKIRHENVGDDYYCVVKKVNEWGFEAFENYLYIKMLECIVMDGDLDHITEVENKFRLINDNDFPVFIKDLAVNGFDLKKEFKIDGKAIGDTLEVLLDFVHQNPHKNTYTQLLQEAYSAITDN